MPTMSRRIRTGDAMLGSTRVGFLLGISLFVILVMTLSTAGGSAGAEAPGTWTTRAPSGLARAEVSFVKAKGKFYLAGGRKLRHQAFDPTTNRWTDVAPFPEKIDHIQAVTVGGKIYYIGGLAGWPGPHSSKLYIYDPGSDTFTSGASMPRGRGAGGAAAHQGKIYYAGGLHNGTTVKWFDVYDPDSDSWSQLPNMPRARDHFHAAVVDGIFYAIGGRVSSVSLNETTRANDAYDLSGGSWTEGRKSLPSPRGGFATAVLGDEVLIIGGEGGGSAHDEVEAYDTASDTWRTLAQMPTARHGIQAVVCSGGVYVADGGTRQGGGGLTDVFEVFSLGSLVPCGDDPPEPPPPPPPSDLVARDSFTRSVKAGWGAADVGERWARIVGPARSFWVNGRKGNLAIPRRGGSQRALRLSQVSARDLEVFLRIGFADAVVGRKRSAAAFLTLRGQEGGEHVGVGLVLKGGAVYLRARTSSGERLFKDARLGRSSGKDVYRIRVTLEGASPSTLRAKAWRKGATEPTRWKQRVSSLGPEMPGSIGIWTFSRSRARMRMNFDNLVARHL
jgi:N-acetylneuraminic acid mutarotase